MRVVSIAIAFSLLFPTLAWCESPVGCYVWKTTYEREMDESMDEEDVCENGMCVTYHPPNCGNCEVTVCFNSEYIECEQYGCDVFYGTQPPGTSFIPCSTPPAPPMSSSHARKCRPTGENAVAYVCSALECANCEYDAWIDTYIDNWMQNAAWTTMGKYTCHCDCWSSPPECKCTASPGA